MADIEVTRTIDRPCSDAWEAISDLARHPIWMKDAKWLAFETDQRRGTGTRMEVATVVGPFRTVDIMEVVGWEEGRHIDVEHRGTVSGLGRISVQKDGDGCRITWSETLRFPWWLGGGLTAFGASPVLRRIWLGNLARLEKMIRDP